MNAIRIYPSWSTGVDAGILCEAPTVLQNNMARTNKRVEGDIEK